MADPTAKPSNQTDSTMPKNPTTEDLARQIETLKSDIANLTGVLSDLGRSKAGEFAGRARSHADDLQSRAHDQAAALRDTAEGAFEDAEAYVRRNPTTALGLAAGLGLLVGLLTSRR